MSDYREILLGCGNQRKKLIAPPDHREWSDLTTVDIDPNCGADHEIDLSRCNLTFTFGPESFDEIHAYHVLEHTGAQGDYRFFFRQWMDFWTLLRPGGVFCGIVPMLPSPWVWADPGHTRVLPREFAAYLNQAEYEFQIGQTAFADYRHIWEGDFVRAWENFDHPQGQYMFVLEAIKPAKANMAARLEGLRDEKR